MADQNVVKQAQAVYRSLCTMLDEDDWHYEKDEENLTISCNARGDDLSMALKVEVDAERQLVFLTSPMPFRVPQEKREAMAIAVSAANEPMVDGSFDYNYQTGSLLFRLTTTFRESLIGKDLFTYMMYVSCNTIDEYNDKFLLVCKKEMDTDEIIKFIKGED